jgi:urease accessory protein
VGSALAHGNAHGHELPAAAAALGFMLASACCCVLGRFIGQVLAERAAPGRRGLPPPASC